MYLGSNIKFLRKQQQITQEQLAEKMNVSRQAVSRWEADEVIPELDKLIDLSKIFFCKLDALVLEDLAAYKTIYSEVTVRKVKAFKMARYVMVTPNPEDDVNAYMEKWARESGLLTVCPEAKCIGWDFPFVSQELRNRFGLRGYAAAYILPEGFETNYPGVEYAQQMEANYAVVTVYEPFIAAFERIPNGYKKIMDYLQANGFKEKPQENILSCFEYIYVKNNRTCMDIFVHANKNT